MGGLFGSEARVERHAGMIGREGRSEEARGMSRCEDSGNFLDVMLQGIFHDLKKNKQDAKKQASDHLSCIGHGSYNSAH